MTLPDVTERRLLAETCRNPRCQCASLRTSRQAARGSSLPRGRPLAVACLMASATNLVGAVGRAEVDQIDALVESVLDELQRCCRRNGPWRDRAGLGPPVPRPTTLTFKPVRPSVVVIRIRSRSGSGRKGHQRAVSGAKQRRHEVSCNPACPQAAELGCPAGRARRPGSRTRLRCECRRALSSTRL